MKTLEKLIGNSTYVVTDSINNRFNFFGLVEVDLCFGPMAGFPEGATEWDLADSLPEDVQRAVDVMAENSVPLDDFTGVATFGTGEETYYLLTW